MWDHIIKNGIVVTGSESQKANIYVKDGKIDIVSSLPVVKDAVEKAVKEAGFDFKGLIEKK